LFAVLFYIPLLLQQAMMLAPFPAGLILLPQALVMAVLMPISGRLYDRIGPRWLAVSGLLIVALGTYQMRHIGLDTSHEHIIWLLGFRAVGLGLCMMPVFTVGMSSVPLALTNQASAFSNVVRQTSSALGVAAFTALVTRQEAQQLTDRAALLPANTPIPNLGSPAIPGWLGVWSLDQQTQLQTFADAVDWLFIIVAILTAAGMILAMFLPSGTTHAASAGAKAEVLVG
jgi:MFS family permease